MVDEASSSSIDVGTQIKPSAFTDRRSDAYKSVFSSTLGHTLIEQPSAAPSDPGVAIATATAVSDACGRADVAGNQIVIAAVDPGHGCASVAPGCCVLA